MKEREDTFKGTNKKPIAKSLNRKTVVNYLLDVIQLLTFLAVFITGLIIFPDLLAFFGVDLETLPTYDLILIHIWIGLLIGIPVLVHIVLHRKWIVTMTKLTVKKIKTRDRTQMTRNNRKYLLNWGLAISSVITFVTGVIKFPGFLQLLGTNPTAVPMYELSVIHDWVGLVSGVFIIVHFALNWSWIVSTTRMIYIKKGQTIQAIGLVVGTAVVLGLIFVPLLQPQTNQPRLGSGGPPLGPPVWSITGTISIENLGTYSFNPYEVNTTRPDIFREGYFSIFDILVHLDNNGTIDMQYHFDESMNTHVIESINDLDSWWYYAYYDGGWYENNVFRMDHYPYKEHMFIVVFRINPSSLQDRYAVFQEEITRKEQNGGKVIIPTVIIDARTTSQTFSDVEVTPHNLRNETFQEGVITAIDVILSLGDQGKLTYDIQWYDTIGTAEVGNYFIVQINDDIAYSRCGFVYEEGSQRLHGNHIHIPSDYRVINSPEYETWFFICI